MKANHQFTRVTVSVAATLLAAASAFSQSGPDAFNALLNGSVEYLSVQPDGRILIGGSFSAVAGVPRTNLARLEPDGRLDTNFVPRLGMYSRRVLAQPDGRVLVGGIYDPPGPEYRGLMRFESDGRVDT